MSEKVFDPVALDPDGLWRCNICGGLVGEFGAYVCLKCIGLPSARGHEEDA